MIIHSPIISGSLTFAEGSTFTLPDGGEYSGSYSGSIEVSELQSSIIPNLSASYDLGSAAFPFRDLYLSAETLKLGGLKLGGLGNKLTVKDSSDETADVEVKSIKLGGLSGNTVKLGLGSAGKVSLLDENDDEAQLEVSKIILKDTSGAGKNTVLTNDGGQFTTQEADDSGVITNVDAAGALSGSFTGSIQDATFNGDNVFPAESNVSFFPTPSFASGISVTGSVEATTFAGMISSSAQITLTQTNSGSFSTEMVGEGTNLYYTDARVKTKLDTEGVISGSSQILGGSGLVSGSSQIDVTATTNYSTVSSHISSSSNPHSVTATQVGLGNVDNTSDVDKPVSTAQQTALDGKVSTDSAQALGSAANVLTLSSNNLVLTRGDGSTDSIDLSAYLDEDSRSIASGTLNSVSGVVTFTRDDASTFTLDLSDLLDDTNLVTSVAGRNGVVVLTKSDVGLANVDNTSDANKPVSTAQQTALDLKLNASAVSTFGGTLIDDADAGTARTTLGLGSLATLSTVNAATITDNSVGAAELNVTGNGTTTQFLRSDGDGTFTWATPADTNTTYSVGDGGLTEINFTSARSSKLDGIAAGATNVTNNNQLTNGAGYITSFDITTQTDSKYIRSDANDTASGIITLSNSTASTTKTTGALVVTGGVGVSGALNVGGDVVAYASSDRRLKDNIVNIENPIEKVQKLNGVTWDWNGNADELQQSLPNVGVIAQEVEEVFPQLVHDRDNGYKGVDYAKLTGLLIEAVKEQQKQIDELKSRLG